MIVKITNYFTQNYIELLGFITTIVCVVLNILQKPWAWFWAIVSSFIYGIVFYQYGLYSDMELQGVFVIISIYGWYNWKFGIEKKITAIVNVKNNQIPYFIAILILFSLISGFFHAKIKGASLPYLDSFLTGISLIGQYFLAKKYIQNWWLWIIANVGYVLLYSYKELYITAFLYIILLVLAVKGLQTWKKQQKDLIL